MENDVQLFGHQTRWRSCPQKMNDSPKFFPQPVQRLGLVAETVPPTVGVIRNRVRPRSYMYYYHYTGSSSSRRAGRRAQRMHARTHRTVPRATRAGAQQCPSAKCSVPAETFAARVTFLAVDLCLAMDSARATAAVAGRDLLLLPQHELQPLACGNGIGSQTAGTCCGVHRRDDTPEWRQR